MVSLSGLPPEAIEQIPFDTILIVEDDEDTCEMLTECIELETSYRVLSFADGNEALQHIEEIKEAHPFLFILDLQLPILTGIQLYDSLHALQELEHIPAIIITAATLKLELECAVAKRNLTLLLKPFDIAELISSIERLLISSGQLI